MTDELSSPYAVIVTAHLPTPETSGGRKRAARLLQTMDHQGIQPVLLTTDHASPEGFDEARRRGWHAEFHTPTSGARDRLEQHLRREPNRTSRSLLARLNELAPSAAFLQFEEFGGAQYLLRAPRETPKVLSMYNVDSIARADPNSRTLPRSRKELGVTWNLRRMAATERRAARLADVTVCVSAADREHFDAAGARRTMLVANGVDDELFETAPVRQDGPANVLFFGQLTYSPNERGIVEFLERGWPRVLAAVPDARLRIAGPSPSDRLRGAAARAGQADVLGFVASLADELADARCVVAPIPFGGGTRIKVLEALAAARAVVGTAVGVEQIGFEDGRQGFVADTPEAMAARTVDLLRNPELAQRLGEQGRVLADAFRWAQVVDPLRPLYREWAQQRSAAVSAARG
jgi:glycosyltransferase involved in cell wall biosynthesis